MSLPVSIEYSKHPRVRHCNNHVKGLLNALFAAAALLRTTMLLHPAG